MGIDYTRTSDGRLRFLRSRHRDTELSTVHRFPRPGKRYYSVLSGRILVPGPPRIRAGRRPENATSTRSKPCIAFPAPENRATATRGICPLPGAPGPACFFSTPLPARARTRTVVWRAPQRSPPEYLRDVLTRVPRHEDRRHHRARPLQLYRRLPHRRSSEPTELPPLETSCALPEIQYYHGGWGFRHPQPTCAVVPFHQQARRELGRRIREQKELGPRLRSEPRRGSNHG